MQTFWFFCLLTLSAFSQTCSNNVTRISCVGRNGMYYQRNAGMVVQWVPGQRQVVVYSDEIFAIAVCNYGSFTVNAGITRTIVNSQTIPTMVNSVGARARIRVDIENSANVNAWGTLIMGSMSQVSDSSLVGTVVYASPGAGTHIYVSVQNSGNVVLSSTSSLRIIKGNLISELVNQAGTNVVYDPCFEVVMANSGNVRNNRLGTIVINDAQLVDEAIDLPLFGGTMLATLKDVANANANTIIVYEGELLDEIVDTENIIIANVQITADSVGCVSANAMNISEGELVDELLDTNNIQSSTVTITATNVANAVISGTLRIIEGELLDEVVDVALRPVTNSRVTINLNNCGNAQAANIQITQGELVDEILDAAEGLDTTTTVSITATNVANARATTLTLFQAQLLDEMLDAEYIGRSCQVTVTGSLVGNAYCQSVRTNRITLRGDSTEGSELLDSPIDVSRLAPSGSPTSVTLNLSRSANAYVQPGMLVRDAWAVLYIGVRVPVGFIRVTQTLTTIGTIISASCS